MPSALVEQLDKALQKKSPQKKHTWQEMDGLGFKPEPRPYMIHAKTLPPLDDDGNVIQDMRDGGRVKAK